MKPLRAVLALLLAAALVQPYVVPVLCAVLQADMNMADCGGQSHVAAAEMQDRCETPGCVMVLVAPIGTALVISEAPATDGGGPIISPDAPPDIVVVPLLPPPRA